MPESLRERLYSTEAIVLARRDLGESDRIYDIYSVRYGKFSVIAKRARRPDNRDGRSLDLLSRVLVELYRGRNLDIVKSVEPVEVHDGLRADLDAFGHACYLAELVRVMTQDRQPDQQLYTLLAQCLTLLTEGVDPWPVTRYFEYALLHASGFQAQLYSCAHCRDPLAAQVNAFSSREGGFLCPKCHASDPANIPMSVNAQKYLRAMDREGLRRSLGLRLDEASRSQVQHALTHYLQHLAERPFASLAVLRSMRSKEGTGRGRQVGTPAAPVVPSA